MTSKALKKPYVEFVGQSGNDVTGSSYLVKYNEFQILVDYGLYQSNNLIEDYKTNKTRHKSLKPKQLDFVFSTQVHIDHIGKLPELYKNGCTAPLYTPKGTVKLMKLMLNCIRKITEFFGKSRIFSVLKFQGISLIKNTNMDYGLVKSS